MALPHHTWRRHSRRHSLAQWVPGGQLPERPPQKTRLLSIPPEGKARWCPQLSTAIHQSPSVSNDMTPSLTLRCLPPECVFWGRSGEIMRTSRHTFSGQDWAIRPLVRYNQGIPPHLGVRVILPVVAYWGYCPPLKSESPRAACMWLFWRLSYQVYSVRQKTWTGTHVHTLPYDLNKMVKKIRKYWLVLMEILIKNLKLFENGAEVLKRAKLYFLFLNTTIRLFWGRKSELIHETPFVLFRF